ncbi:SCO4225 family membrane protein [Streptomyces sp. NPDC101227]|uniref:SCO4225 family membrane protein n=1 Tax=Streptomyces sp. NPDC101227 TaxID=3366136 RepID=UPI00382006B9
MDADNGRPDRPPQPDRPAQPHRPDRLRGLVRLAFGNPVSLGYLALVIAAVAFAVVDELAVHHPDASFSGV